LELESIRSRTREALRARARAGRIAGGRCYGYRMERKSDGAGRRFTLASLDDAQAPIVKRIFEEYRDGRGLKAITKGLNREGVPGPRGGAWVPSAIRKMLQNPRYRGIYVHGKVKKLRRAGVIVRVKADPAEVVVVDIPEWRIVDDHAWFAVQDRFKVRGPCTRSGGAAAKYPLSGIAK
jgi:hypothetical protein